MATILQPQRRRRANRTNVVARVCGIVARRRAAAVNRGTTCAFSDEGPCDANRGDLQSSFSLEVEPMRKLLIQLWRDEGGAVSPEWMLMATVLVLGSVVALAAMKVALYGNVETFARAVAGM